MVPLRWLRSVPFTIQARQTAQDNPVQVQHLVPRCCREDHQTQLLISGGVERRLHLDLTVFKGQGHYPPAPGFVCLSNKKGRRLPASLFESSGRCELQLVMEPSTDQWVLGRSCLLI